MAERRREMIEQWAQNGPREELRAQVRAGVRAEQDWRALVRAGNGGGDNGEPPRRIPRLEGF